MPGEIPPTTPGATPGTGTEPGASGPQSQGPNDPIQPPATGGQPAPATGSGGTDHERRILNMEAAMARMGEERDTARRELEEERRKGLAPDELARLKALDEKDKQRDAREKSLILRYEIASRAPRLGIVDPELAVLLLEKNPKIAVADDGTVTGLDEALKDLIEERPILARKTEPIDGGAGAGGSRPSGKPNMNDFIRGAARGRPANSE